MNTSTADGLALRKPRTTSLILDDLVCAAETIADEVKWLGDFTLPHLVRAHDWLVRYVAAVRQGKEPTDQSVASSLACEVCCEKNHPNTSVAVYARDAGQRGSAKR